MKLIDFDYVVINTKIVLSKYKIIEVDRNIYEQLFLRKTIWHASPTRVTHRIYFER